jgi:capsular polysaccharide transport system permease protein
VRYGQYGTRVPTTFDLAYVGTWVAILNLLGMAALRKARRHMVV